jgi:hypothetical protein
MLCRELEEGRQLCFVRSCELEEGGQLFYVEGCELEERRLLCYVGSWNRGYSYVM